MDWRDEYTAFLRHQDYPEEDIPKTVANASKIVNSLPEPYKSRTITELGSMSRDDFIIVEFDLLDVIFHGRRIVRR